MSTQTEIKPLQAHTAKATITCNTCRREITMQLLVKDNTIEDIGGEMEGCPYSKECMAVLCRLVKGKSVDEAWTVTEQDIRANQGTALPGRKQELDCDLFVLAALKLALRNQARA